MVLNSNHDRGRVDRDAEIDWFANALQAIVGIRRSNCDVGGDSGVAFVDSGESIDVAFAFSGEADFSVVVGPSVSHLTVGDGGAEHDLSGLGAVANDLVFRSFHNHLRIHGDGEFQGGADARITVVNQGRSHGKVSDDGSIGGVDGGESVDVAFSFSFKADGGVVVGPSVGDGAFSLFDGGSKDDRSGLSIVAVSHVLGLVHDHVFDLEGAIDVNHVKVGGVRGTGDQATDGECVVANHAGALHLEREDGSGVAGIVAKVVVVGVDSEDVFADDIASDDPSFAFSAVAEGE